MAAPEKPSPFSRGENMARWKSGLDRVPIRRTFCCVRFDWNPEKNEWLKRNRKVSFEEIALLLSSGSVWKITDHPNQSAYPNQRVFLLPIDDYIHFVPFVMEDGIIFLKTAFPHRKATKMYLKEKHHGS